MRLKTGRPPSVSLSILRLLQERQAATASDVGELYVDVSRTCMDAENAPRERMLNWARVHLCKLRQRGLVESRLAARPDSAQPHGIYKVWEITPAGAARLDTVS